MSSENINIDVLLKMYKNCIKMNNASTEADRLCKGIMAASLITIGYIIGSAKDLSFLIGKDGVVTILIILLLLILSGVVATINGYWVRVHCELGEKVQEDITNNTKKERIKLATDVNIANKANDKYLEFVPKLLRKRKKKILQSHKDDPYRPIRKIIRSYELQMFFMKLIIIQFIVFMACSIYLML